MTDPADPMQEARDIAAEAESRAAEMERRYDRVTLTLQGKMAEIGELRAQVARIQAELDQARHAEGEND